jgi:hypothetical protein
MKRYEELGFGLDPAPPGPPRPFPPVWRRGLAPRTITEAYAPVDPWKIRPLGIARWRWSGLPALFEVLDTDHDGDVDEEELAQGFGRGLALVRGETAGPLDERAWGGSPEVFRLVDANADGRVSRTEVEQALGARGLRLARGLPAHGPALPSGARYGWRGLARWVVFPSREAKADYMRRAAEEDADDPMVLGWARQFLQVPEEERAGAILRFCQECIRYERDPSWHDVHGQRHGIELLDSSAVGLQRGYGDCDLKARLFVALSLSSGLQAGIEPVFRGKEGFPHVRARVLVEPREAGGPPSWEVADPTIVNSRIGLLPRHPLTAWPRRGAH